MQAYTAVAVISALRGHLGYLAPDPRRLDILTRYGRAKAFFQDPNVFAPVPHPAGAVCRCSACCSQAAAPCWSTAPSS